jgi:hypothetical protein
VQENLDFSRLTLFYTIPMFDINLESRTFTYNSSDLTNVAGVPAMVLWANGEMRSVGFLNYEAGKRDFWIDVIATDSGSPPLTTYFRANISVVGMILDSVVLVVLKNRARSVPARWNVRYE